MKKRGLLVVAGCWLLVLLGVLMVPELFDSGVPHNETDDLVKLYADAAARIRHIVLHPKGMTSGAQQFRQYRASEQLNQISRILTSLGKPTNLWVDKNVPAVWRAGVKLAERQAAQAGVREKDGAIQGSFALIDTRAVALLSHDITASLNRAANSMGKAAASILHQTAQIGLPERKIDQILAGGVIEGTPVQTIRALREELQRVSAGGLVEVTDRNGQKMHFDAGYYASMVVRSKTREATVRARHQRLESLGLDLVGIVGRVSKNPCTAYLGKVFSLSGHDATYPPLPFGGPPWHPNCTKSTRPFVLELASAAQLKMAEPDEDTDKLMAMPSFSDTARAFKDLQIYSQVKGRYATTEHKLFGKAA